jgi:pimeloyl-ACP methyl ester carboxylesterase
MKSTVNHDNVASIQKLDVPFLLYVGKEDDWDHNSRALEAARIIRNLKLVTFPNRGHEIHANKELVLPYILEFLFSAM